MTFEVPHTLRFATVLVALATLPPTAALSADAPLSILAGTWNGSGQIRTGDGRTEKLSCRAFYTARDSGSGLGVALRCASQSYKIELRSSIRVAAGRVSGSWEERSFNLGGTVTGSASAGALSLLFSGGTNGSMSVNYSASSQRVSITTSAGGGARVSLSLSKG